MSKNLNIAFAGTPALAGVILDSLLQNSDHQILMVYTQPDRKAGRGQKVHKSEVKQIAEEHSLNIQQPQQANEFDSENFLSKTDLLIVAAYGMILPAHILTRPRLGCINVHTSSLPKWRGAAPIQRAIQAGDTETGISIIQMDAGLDTGEILLQKNCPIDAQETSKTLHDKLALLGAEVLRETLSGLNNNTITAAAQKHEDATYAGKISKQEAQIDWQLSAVEIERQVRAFNPFPVSHTVLNDQAMRVWQSEVVSEQSITEQAGVVLQCTKHGIDVGTGCGVLRIQSMQLPGKKVVTSDAFYNGHPDFVKNEH